MIMLRRNYLLKFIIIILCIFVYYMFFKHAYFNILSSERDIQESKINTSKHNLIQNVTKRPSKTEKIAVAVVACEKRLDETLSMLKSCLIFSKDITLEFIVIADSNLITNFTSTLQQWQTTLNGSFHFQILPLKFPQKDAAQWRKLFKPCASQRLFLPNLLPHIDSLLYLDTDTLFVSPVDKLWDHFKLFNSSHMAALVLEHEDPNISWYSRFAKHPFYGKLGVNSGVMLMNLTRMRAFQWENYVSSVYGQWKTQLSWGDQDIINIIFHYHHDKLLLLDCSYNYRPDQCMYGSACPEALKTGAKILHGSRGSFHLNKQPAFSAVYDVISNFQLGADPKTLFLDQLSTNLERASKSNCGDLKDVFIHMPNRIFRTNKSDS